MLGLFGTLNLGTRALQTQRAGVEVAGQNIANVNNPAYARQRVNIQTGVSLPTAAGPEGTGANVLSIQQLRDSFVDSSMQSELSVGSYWDSQQQALEFAQGSLGELIDRQAQGLSGSASASATGAGQGLGDQLSGLFNAFQAVATSPSTMPERQALLAQAQTVASRFNQISSQLGNLRSNLNTSIGNDVDSANKLLGDVASLNQQIRAGEAGGGSANDLRDLRQQKLEELSQLTNIKTSTASDGTVTVSIGGATLVSGQQVQDTLQTYDAGGGQMLVRTTTGGTPLTLTGGSIQGAIDARDGGLATLQSNLNTLASNLITEVNNVHRAGFGLNGTTGADFFTGTDAASIGVNSALTNDPTLIQAAGAAGSPGDNTAALALAHLASQSVAGLGNQTFSGAYSQTVASLGQSLNDANTQSANSSAVQNMLTQQRDSVSGVSLDEEMSDLVRFQQAYAASARIVTTVDTMLDTLIKM
jgi:flagellar hook-associated protein 1 FlgK